MRQTHLLSTIGALLWAGAAMAQAPQRTTATYEDWTVRCEVHEATKACEMTQAAQVQGQANPLTQIAIGRPSKTEPLKIVFQVPINVWLPTGVRLTTDDRDPGLLASYKRCIPGGCFADSELKDDVVRRMRSATENGKLHFKDAAQKDVTIPVSFKGFGQALDALAKQ